MTGKEYTNSGPSEDKMLRQKVNANREEEPKHRRHMLIPYILNEHLPYQVWL